MLVGYQRLLLAETSHSEPLHFSGLNVRYWEKRPLDKSGRSTSRINHMATIQAVHGRDILLDDYRAGYLRIWR